jgi:hypothetical protein
MKKKNAVLLMNKAVFRIRDGKNQDPDPGLKILYHISESLKTTFWVKILKFFDADPDREKSVFWDKHPGSATLKKRKGFLFTLLMQMHKCSSHEVLKQKR